ncbi:MAG: transcription elongation factor subunit Spt4, partial [Fervidicoccus fontis]
MSKRLKSPYKACIKCKALVEPNVEVCPVCGSKEFTNDWEGLVIVLDVNN